MHTGWVQNTEKMKPERQNVKLAAQLLSNSVSASLKFACSRESMPANTLATADFVKIVNDWFDVMNMPCIKINTLPTRQAYGLQLVIQKDIITKCAKVIASMEVLENPNSKRAKRK